MFAAALSNAASNRRRCSAVCRRGALAADRARSKSAAESCRSRLSLHVLGGDDRVVVLGDDPARHGAHLAERPRAPRAQHAEREARIPRSPTSSLVRSFIARYSSSAVVFERRRRSRTGTICTVALRTSRRNRSTIEPWSSKSQRVRADWPKITCVMPSRCANSTSASATRDPLSFTTFAPSCLREADVVGQRDVVVRLDPAGLFLRRFDVHGVPSRSRGVPAIREPARSSVRALPREAIATITFVGNDRTLEAFAIAIRLGLARLIRRQLPERELAQRGEVARCGRSW